MNNSERWNGELPEIKPVKSSNKRLSAAEKGIRHTNPDGSLSHITLPGGVLGPIQIGNGENLKKKAKNLEGFFKALGIETEE
jgi:hypothetical protein